MTSAPSFGVSAALRPASLIEGVAEPLTRVSHRIWLVAVILVSTAMVAALGFGASAELVGSILFTFPIALCALQRSLKLLWAVAGAASLFTVGAELWGFAGLRTLTTWDSAVNRGLLIASLLTFTAFIQLSIRGYRRVALNAAEIARQHERLASQNAQLETLGAAAAAAVGVRRVADEHLVQMEARYRGLLEAAPDAMVVVDQSGEIVLLNLQAEQQFGYHRDELVGQPVTNIIPTGFAERLIADGTRTAAEALAQQIGTGIELIGHRKDGTEFPIELMLSPLESADEVLVTAAIRDIGTRKDAERHLAQMEARYRGLLEAAPDAMVVVNGAGEIVLLNLQAEKQFGYHRDELVGQPVKAIIPEGFAERLIADGTRTAAEALAQQIGAGIELIGHRKDGAEFPIELMLSPLESADGVLVTAAIRDIGTRKDAERHLAQMEARYRGLLEAAPDAMVVVNEVGEIVLLNLQAEKQFGYRRDELVGQPVKAIIPEGFAERLLADGTRTAAEALAQQIGTGIELTGRRKNGTEFPIELMLSPLESADGVLVTAAIRDGTARREAVEALKQRLVLERAAVELTRSNDDLQQFAYVAAHDLQEPLRMVSSYTMLLASRYRGRLDADADTYIEFAVDGARRMQRLIEDLLAYCQVGTAGHDLRETSSEAALARALDNLQGAIADSGGAVTHDPLPTLIADPAQLTQLFQNLVGNAIKYRGAEPPLVHVSAKKNRAHEWIFSVRDNGMGIDGRYFEKIFLMFQRLHGRSEFSGTGIGLSLCKKIAERHRGRMWVESVPGAGSTFFLALPDAPANAA
jgi:PAS domain S-box-containing protein